VSTLWAIAQVLVAGIVLFSLFAGWIRRTTDAQRTPPPAPPSAVTIRAAEASARRREEVETRPRVTAAGALDWLDTDGLRGLAGQVLSGLEPSTSTPGRAVTGIPPWRSGGIADGPRCALPVWTVDGTPATAGPHAGGVCPGATGRP
jgi:hypothetical protein